MIDQEALNTVDRENAEASREDLKDDNGEFDDPNYRPDAHEPQPDEDLRADTAESIKLAIADGASILSVQEVALAITQGLFDYPGGQIKAMIAVMKEMAEQSDEPLEVVDKTEEHA